MLMEAYGSLSAHPTAFPASVPAQPSPGESEAPTLNLTYLCHHLLFCYNGLPEKIMQTSLALMPITDGGDAVHLL
jgi:hypothetical protein